LKEKISGYDAYLSNLISLVKEETVENGLILSTDYSTSKILHNIISEDEAEVLLENLLFTLCKWDDKYVLLFNDPLISRHGLRSDLEVDEIITKVKDLISNEKDALKVLEAYCDQLLMKRKEEDFKDRGKRIKGKSLKTFSVKKLRKDMPKPVETETPEE